MNRIVWVALFVAAVGLVAPAHAQLADHVVINEIEINPRGEDKDSAAEWVELYNPTSSSIDLGGWEIASTSSKKVLTIQLGTIIGPDKTVVLSYVPLWFVDIGESVELRSPDGAIVDKTPSLTDRDNDFKSWQRLYDGYALNTRDDWKFVTAGPGNSNGKLVEEDVAEDVTISISVDQESYVFGDTAIIRGNVSELVYRQQPFSPEHAVLIITGPEYEKEIKLYPDSERNFEASLSLQRVLGIGMGDYDISARYSEATTDAKFTVTDRIIRPREVVETTLVISTDSSSYIPGQTVMVTITTNKVLPSEGLQFEVTNPDGERVEGGHLFSTDGTFSTGVGLTRVNPIYGTYTINAAHAGVQSEATFEVSKEVRSASAISLETNRTAYGIGDTIVVTGRVNHAFTDVLEMAVTQTKIPGADQTRGLQLKKFLTVMGDGTFEYELKVANYDTGLGDYLFHFSGSVGEAEILVSVVEDPENFARSMDPLTVMSDATSYEVGQTAVISGHVMNPLDRETGAISAVSVYLSEDGVGPLQITKLNPHYTPLTGTKADYFINELPAFTGGYSVDLEIVPNIFNAGTYTLEARHLGHTATAKFTVTDPLDLDGNAISTDKEVYGLSQTVVLTGILPGVVDNTAEIKLTRPDGTSATFDTMINNQRMTWTWDVPEDENVFSTTVGSAGDAMTTSLGVYEILVSFDEKHTALRFKVSLDPENDSLPPPGIFVSADGQVYKTGERVSVSGSIGTAQSSLETAINRVTIYVYQVHPYLQIHTSTVFPGTDGRFSSIFDLPSTMFDDGTYGIKATYLGDVAVTTFEIGQEPSAFSVSAARPEYLPGSQVVITGTGGPDSGRLDVTTIRESDSGAICGTSVCGSILGIRQAIPVRSGAFEHTLELSDVAPTGKYEVLVAADTLVRTAAFEVVDELAEPEPEPESPSTVIEKENRITENEITITTATKLSDGIQISPRVVSGSMIANSGDEAGVNLMVTTGSGTCVIGPDCPVSESTRSPGQIHETIEADGMSFKVRYSGPDVRLEKFSIQPESADDFLPDMDWDVEVLKDDQVSRFYYKITYRTVP